MGHFKITLIQLGFIYIPWAFIINLRNFILEQKKKYFKSLANNSAFRSFFKTKRKYFRYFFSVWEKISILFK